MTNYEFFKNFNNIKISKICKDKKIDYANLMSKRVKEEKEVMIADILENELIKLILEKELNNE